MRNCLLAAAALALLISASAAAQETPNPRRGEAIAKRWCANCHYVGAAKQRSATDMAPAFPEIANDPKTSETTLRAVLTRPQSRMPTDALTRQQISDVIAYLLGLRAR